MDSRDHRVRRLALWGTHSLRDHASSARAHRRASEPRRCRRRANEPRGAAPNKDRERRSGTRDETAPSQRRSWCGLARSSCEAARFVGHARAARPRVVGASAPPRERAAMMPSPSQRAAGRGAEQRQREKKRDARRDSALSATAVVSVGFPNDERLEGRDDVMCFKVAFDISTRHFMCARRLRFDRSGAPAPQCSFLTCKSTKRET